MKQFNQRCSRRDMLRRAGKFATLAALFGVAPLPLAQLMAQAGSVRIRDVRAYPIYINERSDRLSEVPAFDGDDDPLRWNYGGPFEQLPSAIIAIIKTDQGITGFGMGGGGSAAVEIIDKHLKHLLINADALKVEQLWDQMYTSGVLYGRRGLFPMALSALDNALWDIVGKYAGKPLHELLGPANRDRIPIYQTNGDFAQAYASGVRNFKRTTQGEHAFPRPG